jgi:hypothetical protein
MKFEVYKAKNGEFRSRLIDSEGKIVFFPVQVPSPDVPDDDARRVRRNVQAGLEMIFRQSGESENRSPGPPRKTRKAMSTGKNKQKPRGKAPAAKQKS